MSIIRSKYFEYMKLDTKDGFPISHCICTISDSSKISEGIFLVSEHKTKKPTIKFIDTLIQDLHDLKEKIKND